MATSVESDHVPGSQWSDFLGLCQSGREPMPGVLLAVFDILHPKLYLIPHLTVEQQVCKFQRIIVGDVLCGVIEKGEAGKMGLHQLCHAILKMSQELLLEDLKDCFVYALQEFKDIVKAGLR